jgi:DNA-directed RNA polymerase subunit RPC12/RpoP
MSTPDKKYSPICPACGSDQYKKRFFGGNDAGVFVFFILGVVALFEEGPWSRPMVLLPAGFCFLVAFMAMTSKRYRCTACQKTYNWDSPEKIKIAVVCPKCGVKLKGATQAMVGDTAVCTRCKMEFEIKDSE